MVLYFAPLHCAKVLISPGNTLRAHYMLEHQHYSNYFLNWQFADLAVEVAAEIADSAVEVAAKIADSAAEVAAAFAEMPH